MIHNDTPHDINILSSAGIERGRGGTYIATGTPVILHTFKPSGIVPRASQGPSVPSNPIDGVPTQTPGELGAPEGLPEPTDDYHIVSLITVQSARAAGRPLHDLLSPGDLVRDGEGRIIGCLNLSRHV